jgi:hypothetical protein
MNKLQLRRWKRLSLGLARTGYPTLTPARQKKLLTTIEDFIDDLTSWNDLKDICDWDGNAGTVYVCDELSNYLRNNRYEFERERKGWCRTVTGRFGTMLSACVRAGFDMAVSPGAGVIGFTVGNLRDIFDGTIPDWVAKRFKNPATLYTAERDDGVWL